jgi:hypothetical protein
METQDASALLILLEPPIAADLSVTVMLIVLLLD